MKAALATIAFVIAGTLSRTAAPEDEPGNERMAIRGWCRDRGGTGIGDATVTLYLQDYHVSSTKLLRTIKVGEKGEFGIGGLPRLTEENWGQKFYFLVAQSPRHATGVASIRSNAVPVTALEIVMLEPTTVRGRVTDKKGQPVSGVGVWVQGFNVQDFAGLHTRRRTTPKKPKSPLPPYSRVYAPLELLETKTDARGYFEILALPLGVNARLCISHSLYAKRFVTCVSPSTQMIELDPGAVITGRVIYSDSGKPAPNVIVQTQGGSGSGWASVRTDSDGRYRLESLPALAYNVWAKAEHWTVRAHESFAVAAGETREAPALVFIRGGWIVGTIIEEATNKGVQPGKTSDVGLYGPSRPRSGAAIESAKIHPDGTFRIRVAPGRNYVYLRARSPWSRSSKSDRWIEVGEGETVEVKFFVKKTTTPPKQHVVEE